MGTWDMRLTTAHTLCLWIRPPPSPFPLALVTWRTGHCETRGLGVFTYTVSQLYGSISRDVPPFCSTEFSGTAWRYILHFLLGLALPLFGLVGVHSRPSSRGGSSGQSEDLGTDRETFSSLPREFEFAGWRHEGVRGKVYICIRRRLRQQQEQEIASLAVGESWISREY